MDTVLHEIRKYAQVWSLPEYRRQAHGLTLWKTRPEIFPPNIRTALDLGCGHGRLMAYWNDHGIDAWGMDLVDALDDDVRGRYGDRLLKSPLWELESYRRFDVAVAADVLEHIPPQWVDETLEAIFAFAEVLIAQTAEFESRAGGHDLHLTIQPSCWWRARMEQFGGIVEEFPCDQSRGKKHLLRWSHVRG
jgi:SAM-dependent methyltransferase